MIGDRRGRSEDDHSALADVVELARSMLEQA
jgi:hypothetical protein